MSPSSEGRVVCRGVRGATTVEANIPEEILSATRDLLTRMVEANQMALEDIASVFFALTPDLDAVHPARAARELGWTDIALFTTQEVPVPGSLPLAIRVLIHWNTARAQ
ncbi:MAG: chorismate mutase, partial [Anaerolineae bacterium]|nr:chorismate mutase [Anaerolineae bacterium]